MMLAADMTPGTPIKCTNCGAMLTSGAAPIVACEYCHAKVFLGGAGAAPPQVRAPAASRSRGLLALGLVVAVIGGVIAVRSFVARSPAAIPVPVALAERPPTPTVTTPTTPPPPPAPPPIGKVVLAFGEAGTGSGLLTNARAFAVTPSGEIVIAEVDTGRVQVFDAKGAYLRVINVPPSALTKEVGMYGAAADDHGHVVVSRAGDLLVLDVAAGKVVRTIRGDYPDRYYSADVAIAPDGTIYAVTDRTGDMAILHGSIDGKVLGQIAKTNTRRFAVDGLGSLYLTRANTNELEIRNAKGEIQQRFSQGNPARGKLSRPDEIAIDGRGHVFVQESDRVLIFDAEGAFLAELDVGPVADLAVDREGFLYVLDRAKVTKYALTLPR
ncbi:MAG: NHL repeat-containing protein [Proteobacteria bacterium]|nr:NHL repeat-containing protein [Pseudomonadota bacterium]